jgi:hypothetical protein
MPKQCARCGVIKYCKAVREIRVVPDITCYAGKGLPLCKDCEKEYYDYYDEMRKEYESGLLLKMPPPIVDIPEPKYDNIIGKYTMMDEFKQIYTSIALPKRYLKDED